MDYYELLKEIYQDILKSEFKLPVFQTEYDNYLKDAIPSIENLWFKNFKKGHDKIRLIIFAEAPMWGDSESYIYKEEIPETNFFRLKNLNVETDPALSKIDCKKLLLKKLEELGIVFIDVSPFPLNPKNTSICYSRPNSHSRKISSKTYRKIIDRTFESNLKPKFEEILLRNKQQPPKFIYRYEKLNKYEFNLLNGFNRTKMTFPSKIDVRISNGVGNISQEKLNEVLSIISEL